MMEPLEHIVLPAPECQMHPVYGKEKRTLFPGQDVRLRKRIWYYLYAGVVRVKKGFESLK
jgi:hypothetical protein